MNISYNAKEITDNCRFCWMCRHVCPIGNATGLERNTARARAMGASMVVRGATELKEIAEKIKKTFDVEIDKKKIVVEDIRSYGTFECTVKVYTGISAKMFIVVGE